VYILDGSALAARRLPGLRARVQALVAARGREPLLGILGFADASGKVPHVAPKLRAAESCGIAVELATLPPGVTLDETSFAVEALRAMPGLDGLFVQFPYPDPSWAATVEALIPSALDVDVMAPAEVERYFADPTVLPPVTVSAALALMDDARLALAGRAGVVVAEPSPFAEMFRLAFTRRGVQMSELVPPSGAHDDARVRQAALVIVAAGSPGCVDAASLAEGAIAIDVGYFNPGARGDIANATTARHLDAVVPVPGGIGPMTISALLERVILFAERRGA
jgi:methylenetetrahydrofolate dehydrogenase (NADP+)/methenyltetrahydrofolate cyclohydrolase